MENDTMRILIAPMAAIAETSGPFSRAKKLAFECLKRGHDVRLCAAEDVNYTPIDGVPNFYAPIPSPLGLPMWLGKRMFRNAQKLGIQQRKTVHSYEEVLHLTGALSPRHFKADVATLRTAIRQFNPDVVYAEFRIAAIVAAKLEQKPVVTSFSFPVQSRYACNPKFSVAVRKYINECNLPQIESALDIFDWADLKIVPSSYELEPIDSANVVFVGPFTAQPINKEENTIKRNKIVVYMGNGTITISKQIKVLKEAFLGKQYEVYVATKQAKANHLGNITIAERFNFAELLPQSVAFINHGGQNSIMDGLLYGVPQLIYPGKVFERKYNAASVARLQAGKMLDEQNFNAKTLRAAIDEFQQNDYYCINAGNAGQQLQSLGGVQKAVDEVEKIISCR